MSPPKTSAADPSVDASRIEPGEVTLDVAVRSDGKMKYHFPSFSRGHAQLLDLGVVKCDLGVAEYSSSYGRSDAPQYKALFTLGEGVSSGLARLEERLGSLVRASLSREQLAGREVEKHRPMSDGKMSVSVERRSNSPRLTQFYDRRAGVRGRLSTTPPELSYEETVPPGGDTPLKGAAMHAFVELMVWVNHDPENPTVTYGFKPQASQLYLLEFSESRGSGFDASRPVPVGLKRLRELGVCGAEEGLEEEEEGRARKKGGGGGGGGRDRDRRAEEAPARKAAVA